VQFSPEARVAFPALRIETRTLGKEDRRPKRRPGRPGSRENGLDGNPDAREGEKSSGKLPETPGRL
jgi:hypothetical protein